MKHGIQSQKVVAEVIKQKPTVRWLFLTLTVKNVYDGEELNKSLSDMAQGFRRMMQYKKINKNLVISLEKAVFMWYYKTVIKAEFVLFVFIK